MSARRFAHGLARLLLVVLCILTSIYALLGYVPFTAVQFLQFQMIPGLAAFAQWHAGITAIATGAAGYVLWPSLRGRRLSAVLLMAALSGVALLELWRPLFAAGGNGFIVALASLTPAIWLSAIELHEQWNQVSWPAPAVSTEPSDDARWLMTCLIAGASLCVIDVALWQVRGGAVAVSGVAWVLIGDLLIAGAIFAAVMLARGLAMQTSRPAASECALIAALLAAVLAVAFTHVVFASIGFSGAPAWVMAALLAVSVTAALASAAVRSRASSGAPVGSGLEVWLSPAGSAHGAAGTLALMAVVAAVGVLAIRALAGMDWNSLMQQLAAVAIWIAALVGGYRLTHAVRSRGAAGVTAAAALVPLLWLGAGYALSPDTAATAANFAPSFRLLRAASSASGATSDDRAFYTFLQDHANLPRDRHVDPVDVNFVDHFATSTAALPNIFVIVIDSLRPDYLSPYRRSITFTPAIDAFANDSVVFTNAFTRYGATGLSEPSIWTGGMLPHKQYVTPFRPMNALVKLLDAEGYRQYVSLDTVLHTLLEPTPWLVPLDATVQNKDFDLCRTLPELTAKMAAAGSGTPLFAYTQPQTLHISSITRDGASVPAGETYPGLYAPYASRLHHADTCFGDFIASLKRSGQYDNSIIVFTADHGDSLGEEGRWGHAYTLYPEVVRIPLIVHLPPALRSQWSADPAALAFSTDITPTLYALLGQSPAPINDLFGRPLVHAPGAAPAGSRTPAMLVSSYGPVFGVLGDEGRQLYVVDAINFQDAAYDLSTPDAYRSVTITSTARLEWRRLLRTQIDVLSQFYRLDRPPSGQ